MYDLGRDVNHNIDRNNSVFFLHAGATTRPLSLFRQFQSGFFTESRTRQLLLRVGPIVSAVNSTLLPLTPFDSLPLFLSLSDTGNFRVVVLQQLRADSIIVKSFGAIPPFLEETQSCVAPFSYAVVRQVRILKC